MSMLEKSVVVVALPSVAFPVLVMLEAKKFEVVNAVDDAYGNCEAATVEEEKKTPCVQMEVVVAAVVVEKVSEVMNGYAKKLVE